MQLVDRYQYWSMLRRVIGPDWIVGPGIALLREHKKLAKKITASGRDIHVWTINTDRDLQLCVDAGVKAVITDRPAYVLERLGR